MKPAEAPATTIKPDATQPAALMIVATRRSRMQSTHAMRFPPLFNPLPPAK
jgi:hypothetical protein